MKIPIDDSLVNKVSETSEKKKAASSRVRMNLHRETGRWVLSRRIKCYQEGQPSWLARHPTNIIHYRTVVHTRAVALASKLTTPPLI